MSVSFNAYNCTNIFKTKHQISRYILTLCDLLELERKSPSIIRKFDYNSNTGYYYYQYTNTANINGYAIENENKLYMDIMSYTKFDPQLISNFTMDLLKAKDMEHKTNIRY
jgi:hypothetical protein